MIESFLKVLQDTEGKLGRQLQDEEFKFLQWVYKRYTDEEKKKIKV